MIVYDSIDEEIRQSFLVAVRKIHNLTIRLTNDDLLHLYGLYKQGIVGDININKPSSLDRKAVAKWNAWNNQKGKTKIEVRQEYIKLVDLLLEKYRR
jgi:diazepam-binding inhibitor (GABA receptor modulator, acyl-CoA-binding protein)